jgi:hypothetical protein
MMLVPILVVAGATAAALPPNASRQTCTAQHVDPAGPIMLTGSLPVNAFGVVPANSSAHGYEEPVDQAPGIRQAISCFHAVSFGSGDFLVNTTIVLADEDLRDPRVSIGQFVRLRGVSSQKTPRTKLYNLNASSFGGAVLQLGDWTAKYSSGAAYVVESMQIEGVFVGVRVVATSSVAFTNVMVQARQWAVAADGTDIIRDNTAMLISGCFWLSFEKSEFHAPNPPGTWSKANLGTRPSVILRGENTPPGAIATNNVEQVYLLRFTQVNFWYGGVKYEYNVHKGGGPPIGFWDFLTVAMEDSFTPLIEITGNATRPLDRHGQPAVKFCQISVQGYMNADSGEHASSVIRMNLTNASLDGVTMFGIGDVPNAVELVTGQIGSVNILDSRQGGVVQWQGGEKADGSNSNIPVGSTFSKSTGGIAVIGFNPNCPDRTVGCRLVRGWNDSRIYGQTGYSEAAVLIAQEGDAYARLAIRADGSMAFGNVNESTNETQEGYDTIIRRPIARRVPWAPPSLAAGAVATLTVHVQGAVPGDAVTVGMSQLGDADAMLSANVAAAGRVRVLLRNVGVERCGARACASLVLPNGTVSVVVTQFV